MYPSNHHKEEELPYTSSNSSSSNSAQLNSRSDASSVDRSSTPSYPAHLSRHQAQDLSAIQSPPPGYPGDCVGHQLQQDLSTIRSSPPGYPGNRTRHQPQQDLSTIDPALLSIGVASYDLRNNQAPTMAPPTVGLTGANDAASPPAQQLSTPTSASTSAGQPYKSPYSSSPSSGESAVALDASSASASGALLNTTTPSSTSHPSSSAFEDSCAGLTRRAPQEAGQLSDTTKVAGTLAMSSSSSTLAGEQLLLGENSTLAKPQAGVVTTTIPATNTTSSNDASTLSNTTQPEGFTPLPRTMPIRLSRERPIPTPVGTSIAASATASAIRSSPRASRTFASSSTPAGVSDALARPVSTWGSANAAASGPSPPNFAFCCKVIQVRCRPTQKFLDEHKALARMFHSLFSGPTPTAQLSPLPNGAQVQAAELLIEVAPIIKTVVQNTNLPPQHPSNDKTRMHPTLRKAYMHGSDTTCYGMKEWILVTVQQDLANLKSRLELLDCDGYQRLRVGCPTHNTEYAIGIWVTQYIQGYERAISYNIAHRPNIQEGENYKKRKAEMESRQEPARKQARSLRPGSSSALETLLGENPETIGRSANQVSRPSSVSGTQRSSAYSTLGPFEPARRSGDGLDMLSQRPGRQPAAAQVGAGLSYQAQNPTVQTTAGRVRDNFFVQRHEPVPQLAGRWIGTAFIPQSQNMVRQPTAGQAHGYAVQFPNPFQQPGQQFTNQPQPELGYGRNSFVANHQTHAHPEPQSYAVRSEGDNNIVGGPQTFAQPGLQSYAVGAVGQSFGMGAQQGMYAQAGNHPGGHQIGMGYGSATGPSDFHRRYSQPQRQSIPNVGYGSVNYPQQQHPQPQPGAYNGPSTAQSGNADGSANAVPRPGVLQLPSSFDETFYHPGQQ